MRIFTLVAFAHKVAPLQQAAGSSDKTIRFIDINCALKNWCSVTLKICMNHIEQLFFSRTYIVSIKNTAIKSIVEKIVEYFLKHFLKRNIIETRHAIFACADKLKRIHAI